jgi:hypothetical protein
VFVGRLEHSALLSIFMRVATIPHNYQRKFDFYCLNCSKTIQIRIVYGGFSPLVFKFKANSNDANSFIRVHFFL